MSTSEAKQNFLLARIGPSRTLAPEIANVSRGFVSKMTPSRKVLIFVSVLCFLGVAAAGGRAKRELRFPKGASVVAAVALASFLPKGPTDGLAHVLEFDLGFPLPDEFAIDKKKPEKRIWGNPQEVVKTKTWYKNKPYKKFRGKRSLKEQDRKNLLLKIEDIMTRLGFKGSSCTSRLQCELRNISPENSLLEELLIALLKPPSEPEEEECEKHIRTCPVSLLHIIMHSTQIPISNMV